MKKDMDKLSRRQALKYATVTGGLMMSQSLGAPYVWADHASLFTNNRMEEENSKKGTLEWQLQYTRFDNPITLASYPMTRRLRSSTIEGYVSKTSLYPGESLEFKVSTETSAEFLIDIYRLGYYGGNGGRHMATLGAFKGQSQPVPMMTFERLRECDWETCTTFNIPSDWPSGVYVGKLSRIEEFGAQSYVIFVIKDRRKSDVLCQVSDLTWQSYNKWPGNDSLYDDGTPNVWYTGPNVRVSFDRPYAKYCQILDAPLSAGSGSFLLWEHPLVFWLEKHGYDVSYCSNLDLHMDPEILGLSKAFISVGHDEYWSRKMYDEATKARNNGLSFAFLSGNSVYQEVDFFDSSVTGEPCRAFTRKGRFDDAKELMGVSSYGPGYGDWVVKNSSHWIYEGTGLVTGDKIPSMIGWEYHGPPYPDFDGFEIVAESSLSPAGSQKLHGAVVFPCSQGNWVFNAGTIWWPEGLSQPPGHIPAGHNPAGRTFGVNHHVQEITANVLGRMIEDSPL